jgi:hypothetical protein
LIVGAEVGLGGKLMRTVSFFGWTLAASAGLGGIEPPPGGVGTLSGIFFSSVFNVKLCFAGVKPELQFPAIASFPGNGQPAPAKRWFNARSGGPAAPPAG